MSNIALTMMIATQGIILCITLYLFLKVLRTPAQSEPDSYSDNDDCK